jgi:hypothetical protein
MRFSEWLEKKLCEALNPELESLRRQEKQLLMSMEMRKDPSGAIYGINRAGYMDASNKLKEVRAKIKELEGSGDPKQTTKPIPDWIRQNLQQRQKND